MGSFIPTKEAPLVTYTNNFSDQLTAKATQVGLVAADATAFATLNTAWTSAYATANEPATRTRPAVQAKNIAKRACVARLRQLAARIQKYPGTTDVLRSDFGLPIPAPRRPVPVPEQIPTLEVTKRWGTTIVTRIHDGTARKAKPVGVQGARVYSYVGPTPPTNVNDWVLEGQTTRMDVEIEFASSLPAGTVVWITAAYYNPRGQLGPGCQPVSTVLAGAAMNLAA